MDTYPISTVCNFTCDKGFKNAQRLNIMECQEDGTWSGTLTQCKRKKFSTSNLFILLKLVEDEAYVNKRSRDIRTICNRQSFTNIKIVLR